MPDNERLWRTEDGDLVPEGHPDALLLAYGVDDALTQDDIDNVREIELYESDEDDVIEGVLVESDVAGTGDAVNAETGEVTAGSDPLPVVEQTDGDELPEPDDESDDDDAEKAESVLEPEKPVDEVAGKPVRRPSSRRK